VIFFLPGETLVVIGGVFAAHGELELGNLIGVVSVGAILGYCIGFELGRRFGRVRLQNIGRRFGLREMHFNRVDTFFARYGGGAVFWAVLHRSCAPSYAWRRVRRKCPIVAFFSTTLRADSFGW